MVNDIDIVETEMVMLMDRTSKTYYWAYKKNSHRKKSKKERAPRFQDRSMKKNKGLEKLYSIVAYQLIYTYTTYDIV